MVNNPTIADAIMDGLVHNTYKTDQRQLYFRLASINFPEYGRVKIPSKINSQGGLDGNRRTGEETDEVHSKR